MPFPWFCVWVSATAPGPERRSRDERCLRSCALRAGKCIGSFVLIASTVSADPSHIAGGGWVWRVDKGFTEGFARCVVLAATPVQVLGCTALLAASSISVEVPAAGTCSAGTFCWSRDSFVVGLGREPVLPSLPAQGQNGAGAEGCLWTLGTRLLGCSPCCSQRAFLGQAIWRGSRSWTFALSWVERTTLCQQELRKPAQWHYPSLAAWTTFCLGSLVPGSLGAAQGATLAHAVGERRSFAGRSCGAVIVPFPAHAYYVAVDD